MATISAAGIGSGLDVNSILEQIVEAERAPTENRLSIKESTLQAELSAYGLVKSSISSFQSSLGKLKSPASFTNTDVTVSNSKPLTATTTSIAPDGTYSVEVKNLAQSHTLASIAFENLDDVVGSGTLNFSFGTTDYNPGTGFEANDDSYTAFVKNEDRTDESIVIDNTNNTVEGIRDAINNSDIGVTASIVDDGTGYRLLMSSDQQGFDNSMEISVIDDDLDNENTSGLSSLAFNSSATNVEQTQSAQDAEVAINGLTVFRESNTVSGAIPGVTLNLKSVDDGNPVQVTVSNKNVTEAQTNIRNFVNAFNEMAAVFNGLTKFGGEEGENGLLLGDTTTRNILQQTRRELGSVIENGGNYDSLSSIGITTNRDGTLSLDMDEMTDALNDDFDSVAQLFYANGHPSDSEVIFNSSSSATLEGDYPVSISSLATQGKLLGETGVVSVPVTFDSGNNTFSLSVDGVNTGTITITPMEYTSYDDLAREIESQINNDGALERAGINTSVSFVNGAFEIASSTYGRDSSVSVVSQNSKLGFNSEASSSNGSDVAGSVGGRTATGNGRLLTGSGDASGLVLEITGDFVGGRGSVTFSQGLASKLDSLLSDFLDSDGQLTAKTNSISEQIDSIAEQRTDLLKRVGEIEERYRRQFSALDVLISQLNATSSFLQQQLDGLPTIGNNK